MFNLDKFGLHFCSSAGETLKPANDDSRKILFTNTQLLRLNALVTPYMHAGLVTGFEYKVGPNSSSYSVVDNNRPHPPYSVRNNVIFCVAVRQGEDEPPRYGVNIGQNANIQAETLNFDEVMRTARFGLGKVFPDVSLPQRHLSLL